MAHEQHGDVDIGDDAPDTLPFAVLVGGSVVLCTSMRVEKKFARRRRLWWFAPMVRKHLDCCCFQNRICFQMALPTIMEWWGEI